MTYMGKEHVDTEHDCESYVDAAAASSNRGRFVLIAMTVASVVAFGGYWNSRQASWTLSEMRIMQNLLRWWDCDPLQTCAISANDSADYVQVTRYRALRKLPRDSITKTEVGENLKLALSGVAETATFVRVPFFGIVFHVNDLGLLSGFTFAVLLMWLKLSIWRENTDLRLVFAEARQADEEHTPRELREPGGASSEQPSPVHTTQLKRCYDLLSMRQVLTIPSRPGAKDLTGWPVLPRLLFGLPLLVQVLVGIHDAATANLGMSISQVSTIAVMVLEWVFAGLVAIWTYDCIRLSRETDVVWQEAARGITGNTGE
jgi:hypothetical protein